MAISQTGTKGFFVWLQNRLPRVYSDVKREFADANQLNGLGIPSVEPIAMAQQTAMTPTLSQTVMDIANTLAQGYLTKKQVDAQNKILKVNLDRAKRGLAPIDFDPGAYGLPRPSIGVGLTDDTKKLLLYGGLGLGALMLLGVLKPSRR